jgi:hypothetical protein
MKLMRYGPKGQEKPALVDGQGRVRDLSALIGDLAPKHLTRWLPSTPPSCRSSRTRAASACRGRASASSWPSA